MDFFDSPLLLSFVSAWAVLNSSQMIEEKVFAAYQQFADEPVKTRL
jgi:hypothetical protein